MFGDWALPDRQYSYIALLDLAREHMPRKQAQTIRVSDICTKSGDWFDENDSTTTRYEATATKYPGMVIHAMPQ